MLNEILRKSIFTTFLTICLLEILLENQMADEKETENLKVVTFEKRPSDLKELQERAEKLKFQASQLLQSVIPVLDEISKTGLKLEFGFMCDPSGKWHVSNFKMFKEF